MGYQGGRRYGDDYYAGQPRYAGFRHWREDHRYGPRGWFGGGRSHRSPPSDYDPDERGFFDRAGDEVRSWFGDEEAERRREYDEYYNRPYGDPRDESSRIGFASASGSGRYLPNQGYAPFTGERSGYGSQDHGYRIGAYGPEHDYGEHHDANYYVWRQQRISELDRDYAEYQRENRERFDHAFGSWRTRRGEQRQALSQVREHMEVVGSDGEHVGTVDKLHGDRIVLTRNDEDAGGMHHSIPSSWIKAVDAQKVMLEKTADQAQSAWRAERERAPRGGSEERSGWDGESRSGGGADAKGRYR
ncbi:hypothetical protein SAMN02927924_01006 [Sphingobium faniae]|nr:hypothetical protein SAMN02927924_01006 [Sphingobium faniae]